MKTLVGADAAYEFTNRIKTLKDNHQLWCAVVVTWQGEDQAPWLHEHLQFSLIAQAVQKTLGGDASRAVFLALPSGALLLLAETISNSIYRQVAEVLENAARGLPAMCAAFDLSAMWDGFFEVCRKIYTPQAAMAKPKDTGALLKRLDARMEAAKGMFKQRNLKAKKLILLFVEDEPSIRQLLTTLLAHENFHLRFAANGEEAVLSYADLPPHIVFLDIQLPDISGLDVLDMIARHDPEAYPIMLTGNAAQTDVKFALERGIKGYIVKPFSWQKLTECLQRYHLLRD